jgi:hypothetical protein
LFTTTDIRRARNAKRGATLGVPDGSGRIQRVFFEISGAITDAETFAAGTGIRERPRLIKRYGKGRWRKRKGFANVKLSGGTIRRAELHWYEASGIGKKEFKIKRFVD